jgi:hypothetical protein
MEKEVGGPFDVTFSVDVGPNTGFSDYLQNQRGRLESEYGFKVDFVFLESGPIYETRQDDRKRKRRR